jgi:GTPase SAR1 family protein
VLIYLVGNKADLDDERDVQKGEGVELVKEMKFHNHFETSAYTGDSVQELFNTITKHLYFVNKQKLENFVRN